MVLKHGQRRGFSGLEKPYSKSVSNVLVRTPNRRIPILTQALKQG
jgi:hypothetical protein